MTPSRMRERVRTELQHRAVGAGFRRARYTGESTRSIRADALAGRATESVGSEYVTARDPDALRGADVAVGATALIGGAVLGHWLVRRSKVTKVEGAYAIGLDVLGARY